MATASCCLGGLPDVVRCKLLTLLAESKKRPVGIIESACGKGPSSTCRCSTCHCALATFPRATKPRWTIS
eukprot:255514-Amphidinium_carterae.1